MTQPTVYRIYYDATIASVVMEWQGLATSQEFRQGSEEMRQMVYNQGITRVLADLTHMKLIALQEREWLLNDFLPRVLEAGLKTIAFVRSSDYHNQLSIGTVVYEIDPEQLEVAYFESRSEAEAWLKNE